MTTVVEAWANVMEEVLSVGKTGHNSAQDYNFRGVDAVVNAVGPAFRKHKVAVTPRLLASNYRDVEVGRNRTLMREVTVEVEYTVRGPEGDTFDGSAPGESMDSGDKGTAKAMSVAWRTWLIQALAIPTHEPDPDETSYERATREQPAEPERVPLPAELVARLDALPTEAQDRLVAWASRAGEPNIRTVPPSWVAAVERAVTAEEAKSLEGRAAAMKEKVAEAAPKDVKQEAAGAR